MIKWYKTKFANTHFYSNGCPAGVSIIYRHVAYVFGGGYIFSHPVGGGSSFFIIQEGHYFFIFWNKAVKESRL